jgi:hypothetical protein
VEAQRVRGGGGYGGNRAEERPFKLLRLDDDLVGVGVELAGARTSGMVR